jgi:hypothetical protein
MKNFITKLEQKLMFKNNYKKRLLVSYSEIRRSYCLHTEGLLLNEEDQTYRCPICNAVYNKMIPKEISKVTLESSCGRVADILESLKSLDVNEKVNKKYIKKYYKMIPYLRKLPTLSNEMVLNSTNNLLANKDTPINGPEMDELKEKLL